MLTLTPSDNAGENHPDDQSDCEDYKKDVALFHFHCFSESRSQNRGA